MKVKPHFAFLGWDGAFPLLVAGSFDLLRFFMQRDAAELLAIAVVPAIAALLRCAIGVDQLRKRRLYVGWLRPCILAAAIVTLMLFDGAANLLRCKGVPFFTVAPIAAALYAGYLVLIWLTFKNPSVPANGLCELPDAI